MSGFIRGMEAGYGLGDRIMNQYDEDQLRNDLRGAGDDPNAVAKVYAKHGKADKAMQMRATGLQMKGLERADKQADLEQKTLDMMRRLETGEDPVKVFGEARGVYAGMPNGYSASMTTVNGQPFMVHTNDEQGQSQLVPMTRETVAKALEKLHSMTSMGAYQNAQKLGVEDKKLGLEQKKLHELGRHNLATEDIYQKRADTEERGLSARLSGAELAAYQLQQQKLFDTQRSRIIADLEAGVIDEKTANKNLNRLAMKFGGRPLADERASKDVVLKEGEYRMSPDGSAISGIRDGQFVTTPTPGGVDAVKAALREGRGKTSAAQSAALRGTSGSHAPADAYSTAPVNDPVSRELADINMRLNLPGVSEATRLNLLLRQSQLRGGGLGGLGRWLPREE